jgi:hypothetical protein
LRKKEGKKEGMLRWKKELRKEATNFNKKRKKEGARRTK